MSLMGSYVEIKSGLTALQNSPEGTTSFKQDQSHIVITSVAALLLDALSCVGMWGLIAIVLNVISLRWQLYIWISAMIAGFGSSLLRVQYIGPQTDHNFMVIVIIIPAFVGTASILGFLTTLLRPGSNLNPSA